MATTNARLAVVGSGASTGCPWLYCAISPDNCCPVCAEALADPRGKNTRSNPSAVFSYSPSTATSTTTMAKQRGLGGVPPSPAPHFEHHVLVDVGKTFRDAAMRSFRPLGVHGLRAVLLTHPHADAFQGLDDLRDVSPRASLPVYADARTYAVCAAAFPYLANPATAASTFVARLEWRLVEPWVPFAIPEAGGLVVVPFPVEHGVGQVCMAYEFAGCADPGRDLAGGDAEGMGGGEGGGDGEGEREGAGAASPSAAGAAAVAAPTASGGTASHYPAPSAPRRQEARTLASLPPDTVRVISQASAAAGGPAEATPVAGAGAGVGGGGSRSSSSSSSGNSPKVSSGGGGSSDGAAATPALPAAPPAAASPRAYPPITLAPSFEPLLPATTTKSASSASARGSASSHAAAPGDGDGGGDRVLYVSDVSALSPEARAWMRARPTALLILDALNYMRYSTHFSMCQAVNCVADVSPRSCRLVGMNHRVDHSLESPKLAAWGAGRGRVEASAGVGVGAGAAVGAEAAGDAEHYGGDPRLRPLLARAGRRGWGVSDGNGDGNGDAECAAVDLGLAFDGWSQGVSVVRERGCLERLRAEVGAVRGSVAAALAEYEKEEELRGDTSVAGRAAGDLPAEPLPHPSAVPSSTTATTTAATTADPPSSPGEGWWRTACYGRARRYDYELPAWPEWADAASPTVRLKLNGWGFK